MLNIRSGVFNWFLLVLAWIFFTNIFAALSGLSLRLVIRSAGSDDFLTHNQVAQYLYSNYRFIEATLFGILFGTVFYLSNKFIERSPLIRKSFWKIIIIKSVIYIFSMIAITAAISGLYVLLGVAPAAWTQLVNFISQGQLGGSFILVTGFYFGSLIVLTNFLILTSRKFGPGNLFLIFLGRYHTPKVENRIFMFIDLKASTTYAEQLGHIRYSKLIQSCFHDLNKVVAKYRAEIYQYVGDEAALTWTLKEGLKDLNCIRVFFAFRDRINAHANYYKKRYGMVPEFKAGLNAGRVTVAEVGDIKREIAYHGDVVNTVARIQHLCNEFNVPLLATEEIMEKVKNVDGYQCEMMGSVTLKGKQNEVAIYAIY